MLLLPERAEHLVAAKAESVAGKAAVASRLRPLDQCLGRRTAILICPDSMAAYSQVASLASNQRLVEAAAVVRAAAKVALVVLPEGVRRVGVQAEQLPVVLPRLRRLADPE